MDNALEKAIYYPTSEPEYKIIVTLEHDGTETNFKELISSFQSDINIKNMFGPYNNISYKIFNCIGNSFKKLLIDQLDVLHIVTRQDSSIKIVRKSENQNNKIGIIKIDGVLSEMKLTNNGTSWVKLSTVVVIIGLLTGVYFLSDYHLWWKK